jgi:hypothetical protein
MSKVPIHTQILYDRHQDFSGLEVYLDGTRKVQIDDVGTYEPLSKYIDADRLMEIAGTCSPIWQV